MTVVLPCKCPAVELLIICEGTARCSEKDVGDIGLPEPDLEHLNILLVDKKFVRKGHG